MKRKKLLKTFLMSTLVLGSFAGLALTSCGAEETTTPTELTITSISVDTTNVQTVFAYAETFNYDGLVVIGTYDDGTTTNIDLSECTVSTPDTTMPGTRNVTVRYGSLSTRYSITVNERVMPDIDSTPLVSIEEEDEANPYRVEAESINTSISNLAGQDGTTTFVTSVEEGDENITSNGQYISNYGVVGNYFGFTFTTAEEFSDVIIVLRLSNPTSTSLDLSSAFNLYLNYENMENTGAISLSGYAVSAGDTIDDGEGNTSISPTSWQDVVIRNITLPQGTNTLTFDVLSENVPNIDYVDFYVGARYISTVQEINGVGRYEVDIETMDTERANTRSDVAAAYGLGAGELFVETPYTESEIPTTNGQAVGAIAAGSQISTTLRIGDDTTISIYFKAAKTMDHANYKIADNWKFYIDGVQLINVQDLVISSGDPSQGQYWDWKLTNIGIYNLEEGDHLFTVAMNDDGTDCNVDTVIFDVLTYGEYDETGVALDEQDGTNPYNDTEGNDPEGGSTIYVDSISEPFTIDQSETYVVEAELFDEYEGITMRDDQNSLTEAWSNDLGSGYCLKGFTGGSYLTIEFTLVQETELVITTPMSYYDDANLDVNSNVSFVVDETTSLTASYEEGGFGYRYAGDYWNWNLITLETTTLEAGSHSLKVTFNTQGINVDYFAFAATLLSE